MIRTSHIKVDLDKTLQESIDIVKEQGIKAAVEYFSFQTGWTKKDSKLYITNEDFRIAHKAMMKTMEPGYKKETDLDFNM